MNSSEAVKRSIGVLGEAMNSACYIHDAEFRDIEEVYELGAREKLAESVYFPLCEHPYNVRR